MTTNQTTSHKLIEYIISLLSIPGSSGMDLESLLEAHGQAKPTSPQDAQNIRAAYELMQFMDEMPGGFFIYRADGSEEIIYANKALLRIFQCTSLEDFKEHTNNSFMGLVHPDDLDAVEQSIQEQIASSQNNLDYVEYRIIRKDGTIRWIEDFGHFIHSKSIGDIFYVFISDVTEKKKRRMAEIKQQEQTLQNIIEQYDKERKNINKENLRRLEVIEGLSINYESILYSDLDEDIILPYRLSSRLMYQFDNMLQTRSLSWYISDYIRRWVHPEDRENVRKCTALSYIREKLSQDKTYYINYRVLNGREVQYLQLRMVNVGSGDHVSQVVLGYRSVDDEIRREIEQKQILEQALGNAKLAITAKNTFLSNMSHDMRTPLNAIVGYAALAKKHTEGSHSVKYYLDKIEESSGLLLGLIDKVLEIAWSETEDLHIAETECRLWDIMQDVRGALLAQASEKEITLSLNSAGLTHSDVISDPDKLKQVLSYLTSNAIKYTPKGGRVDMMVMELENLPNDYAVYQFAVEDNGIGISKEFLNHIYEPFEREKNTTFSGVIGAGLGLTIAKNIIDVMGGKIEAESTLGSGSRFTVTLRLKIQNCPLPFSINIDDVIGQLMDQTILLVEDNEINMEIEAAILEGLGFIIDKAEDGSVAVEKMRKAKPGDYALILMDIQMPVMNGRQATKAIRKLADEELSHIPIIALSADAFESDKRKSIESGMDAHLPKPIDIPLLLETIAKTVKNHEFLYGNACRNEELS